MATVRVRMRMVVVGGERSQTLLFKSGVVKSGVRKCYLSLSHFRNNVMEAELI